MNPDLEAAEAVYVLSSREVVCGSNLPYVFLSFLASCFLLPVFTSFLGSRNLSWWGPELVMVGLVEKRVEKDCYEWWLDRHPIHII